MTNKSLSQQICEVCGIDPQIIEDYELNDIELYPDFENNNNNFINLLELFHKNNFYINDISINCVIEKETFVIYFLKYLIKVLTDETISEKVKDVLKQAIKNNQWEV